MEEIIAGKLLGLAAVAANSAAVDLAFAGVESEEEEEDRCSWSRDGGGDTASYEEGGSEDEEEDDRAGKRKMTPDDRKAVAADRKARNRERNRLHARKTRQRKKQHVQELQLKIWGLRQERQRLLQLSTDHRTAGVLLALSCSPKQCQEGPAGNQHPSSRSSPASKLPKAAATPTASRSCKGSSRDWGQEVASHEDALRKITQEFERMDGSQQAGDDEEAATHAGGKGGGGSRGAKGTLSDRTALRRERNRMHAKRTRNRKKLFVEACSVMIDKMKVENAQLEYEIRASGIQLPEDSWAEEVRETIPEEPLPEYLAALWDFAEGKSHSTSKAPGSGVASSSSSSAAATATPISPPATPRMPSAGAFRQSRQTSSSSSASSASCSSYFSTHSRRRLSSAATTKVPPRPPSPPLAGSMVMSVLSEQVSKQPAPAPATAAGADPVAAASNPGQALEDASALCAFMEAAQTRSVKRVRVAPQQQQQRRKDGNTSTEGAKQMQAQPRGWSDQGSTTSESRGGSDLSEEDAANERKSADGSGASNLSSEEEAASSRDSGAVLPPEFWTSRQVLERYVLPRQQFLQG
ncbi:unnamed protein product [Ectocarpus sp. 12 AP-2014]